MHIAFACDAVATALKKELIAYAQYLGHTCHDCGISDNEPNDYPIYGARAAKLVQSGECERGVVLCGTGVGMSLVANKHKGIRCALCSESYTAKMTRAHNDANMLAMGARVIGSELAKMILFDFLTTPYDGERHQRRIDMIARIEEGEMTQ